MLDGKDLDGFFVDEPIEKVVWKLVQIRPSDGSLIFIFGRVARELFNMSFEFLSESVSQFRAVLSLVPLDNFENVEPCS